MKKKELKEKLLYHYTNENKLMFLKNLKDCINSDLKRTLYGLVIPVFNIPDYDECFNTLWSLLNELEKKHLKYYKDDEK